MKPKTIDTIRERELYFKEMKNNIKETKGITLVALVITIVVLLILAGVSIVTLFGESGIITATQKAANLTKDSVENDLNNLKDLEKDLNKSLGIVPEIKKGEMVDKETKYAKYTDSTSSAPAYIPGGYGVVQDSTTDTDEARKVNTIANGLVISDLAGDTLDNELINGKRGNQFVWVPVTDINSMYGTTEDGKQYGKLYDYGTKDSPKTEPEVKAYPTTKNSGCREPDVVTGASSGSNSWTGASYDGAVANLNRITDFKVAEGQTKTAELFKNYLQKEFDNMIGSVKKYKGFYIGRYETGNLSNTNSNTVKAVVQKGNSNLGSATWYAQYQEIKNMTAENNNVTTSIIWGCQWDRTLNWLIETENNGITISQIVDSRTWGNYKYSTGDAAIGKGMKQTSGYNKAWQKNHIYDMVGNVYDWTMEASDASLRVDRGGYYGYSGSNLSASSRDNGNPINTNSSYRFSFHTLRKSVTDWKCKIFESVTNFV